jgi:beta-galactosidase
VEFEGVRLAGEVYLNGKLLGRHENGVSAFGFDITADVKPAPAENVIAVRTDNSWKYEEVATGTTFHWSDSNFYANYGGINRNVWLHLMAPVHQTLPLFSSLGTTGTYIWASDFDLATSSAKITAESQVRNDSSKSQAIGFTANIRDAQGTVVATMAGPSTTLAPGETRTISATTTVTLYSNRENALEAQYTALKSRNLRRVCIQTADRVDGSGRHSTPQASSRDLPLVCFLH